MDVNSKRENIITFKIKILKNHYDIYSIRRPTTGDRGNVNNEGNLET